MSNAFIQFTTDAGIVRQHTVRNRPQQNGVAERANRTMAEGVTAMLAESGLPLSFWGEALASYVHVWNCLPTSAILKATTPYELWHGRKPDVSHFQVWGCTAYVHVQRDQRNSLGPHVQKCAFIGYPAGYKGWKFWDLTSRNSLISETADFDERYFPARKDATPIPMPSLTPPASNVDSVSSHGGRVIDFELDTDSPSPSISHQGPIEAPPALPTVHPTPAAAPTPPTYQSTPTPSTSSSTSSAPSQTPIMSPSPIPSLQRSTRERRAPGEWWKVHREPTPIIKSSDESAEEEQDSKDDSEEEIERKQEADEDDDFPGTFFTDPVRAFTMALGPEPSTYKQAMARSDATQWTAAAKEELDAHTLNGTWELSDLPPGRKAIGSRWVFKVKRKADGSIECYKARLVAKGFSQRPGFDFNETFAPTAKFAAIRTILALAGLQDLHLHSIDNSHMHSSMGI